MDALPDMHDGFFEGFFASESKTAHLFFRSRNGERSTIVLSDVERLDVSGFKAGNIVLDMVLTDSSELTLEQIEHLYELSNVEKAHQLLKQAQEKGLRALGWAADDPVGLQHAIARSILSYACFLFAPEPYKATAISVAVLFCYTYSLIRMRKA